MRSRLTRTQYSASVEVPFEIVVQIQNNEEIIKEIQARPGLLAREAFTSQPLVASLFPGETTEINLVVTLPRTTTSGLYQLPIEIRDENGIIGNPMRATKAKGEEAFHRYSTHVSKGVLELMKVPVNVKNREFINRV